MVMMMMMMVIFIYLLSCPLPPQSAVMSPLQMLRTALHVLAEQLPKGVVMARDDAASAAVSASAAGAARPPAAAIFKQHSEVVFVDFTGWLNLTAGMSKSALAQVRTSWEIPNGLPFNIETTAYAVFFTFLAFIVYGPCGPQPIRVNFLFSGCVDGQANAERAPESCRPRGGLHRRTAAPLAARLGLRLPLEGDCRGWEGGGGGGAERTEQGGGGWWHRGRQGRRGREQSMQGPDHLEVRGQPGL